MDYQQENQDKKRKLTRDDFKKDVKDATIEATEETKKTKTKKKKKAPNKGKYSDWKVGELRRHVNEKKKALLTKAGFPEGKVPRSKAGLITLCRRLKRKRW
jgi:hypothetical protein